MMRIEIGEEAKYSDDDDDDELITENGRQMINRALQEANLYALHKLKNMYKHWE